MTDTVIVTENDTDLIVTTEKSTVVVSEVGSLSTGVNLPSFFSIVDLIAYTPLTIQHNLGLLNKDSFVLAALWNAKVISLRVNSIDVNSLEIESSVNLNQVSVVVLGVQT